MFLSKVNLAPNWPSVWNFLVNIPDQRWCNCIHRFVRWLHLHPHFLAKRMGGNFKFLVRSLKYSWFRKKFDGQDRKHNEISVRKKWYQKRAYWYILYKTHKNFLNFRFCKVFFPANTHVSSFVIRGHATRGRSKTKYMDQKRVISF